MLWWKIGQRNWINVNFSKFLLRTHRALSDSIHKKFKQFPKILLHSHWQFRESINVYLEQGLPSLAPLKLGQMIIWGAGGLPCTLPCRTLNASQASAHYMPVVVSRCDNRSLQTLPCIPQGKKCPPPFENPWIRENLTQDKKKVLIKGRQSSLRLNRWYLILKYIIK